MNISFNNLPLTYVPDEWIYKHYLQLKTCLDGRTVRIASAFNNERTPSMFLYVKNGKYLWKDHSSGYGGNAIELVKCVIKHGTGIEPKLKLVIDTIEKDYNIWKQKNGEFEKTIINPEIIAYDLVSEHSVRSYDTYDEKYWAKFNISINLLQTYNVLPLKHFKIGKHYKNGITKWSKEYKEYFAYGYYLDDGTLLKIYCPHSDVKHISLKNDILGREQLENKDTLIICSSMKDMLALKSLELELDVIAPMSEKTLIPKSDIDKLRDIYTNILTMFDNDKTGVRAMMLYRSLYNLDFVYLPFEKDIAEFIENASSLNYAKHEIVKRINKKIITLTNDEKDEFEKSYITKKLNKRGIEPDEEINSRHPH